MLDETRFNKDLLLTTYYLPPTTHYLLLTSQSKSMRYADMAKAAPVSGASACLSGISVVVPRTWRGAGGRW